MKPSPTASPWLVILAMTSMTVGALALLTLYLFDPAQHGFYPVCPLYKTTGLLCPGCGSLRALHQLTHGHFVTAWEFNPFLITFLPAGLYYAAREAVRWATGAVWPSPTVRPVYGWILLAAFVLFGILRNVPAMRFAALPH